MANTYEDQSIARQRQLAQALMQRGMNPQAVNGYYGNTNMLADVLSSAVGAFGEYRAGQREKSQADSLQKTLARALGGPQAPADGVGPMEDKTAFMIRELSGNPQTAPIALDYRMKQDMKRADNEADLQQALALAEAKKSMGVDQPDPYWTTVNTVDGIFDYNARTGERRPWAGASGKPILAPAASPDLAGARARATATGKAEGEAAGDIQKRVIGSKEILDLTKRARELIPAATSSGVGAATDSVAGFFGKSPPGANEAAALKVLAGNLTLKQPRMEGPQSDADRKLYAQMAADVGNASLPAGPRLAALAEIERLNEKYAAFNGAFDGGVTPVPPQSEVRDWNDLQ